MQESGRHCLVIHILPASVPFLTVETFLTVYALCRARRNAQGHLEPDAPDDVVQASQGFAGYELAPKVEDRQKTNTA